MQMYHINKKRKISEIMFDGDIDLYKDKLRKQIKVNYYE